MFANAIVRRLAYVLVAPVLGWVGIGRAEAQTGSYSCASNDISSAVVAGCDQGKAYQQCKQLLAKNIVDNGAGVTAVPEADCETVKGAGVPYYHCRINVGGATYGCGVSGQGERSVFRFAGACSARPAAPGFQLNLDEVPSGIVCDAGCLMSMASEDVTDSYKVKADSTLQAEGAWIVGALKPQSDGDQGTCLASDAPAKPTPPAEYCHSGGGFTTCFNKDTGITCQSHSNGSKFCFGKTETGPKVDGSREKGAVKPAPGTPPQPPNNRLGENFQIAQTSNVTNNSTTGSNNTNITIAAVTNAGTPGTNAPAVPGDGGNSGGGGQQAGPGEGTGGGGTGGTTGGGTGGGTGTGDGEGAGSAGAGIGTDLYTKTEKTIASVYGDFKSRVEGSEFGSATTGFIGNCAGGGACPGATWDSGGDWGITFSLAELCAGALASILAAAGWVFLAGVGVYCLKVAVL